MPYLKPEERERLDRGEPPSCAGHLNYLITKMFNAYLEKMGLKYQNINDCIGAAEGAKLELYRAVGGPYEELKITENGPVYAQKATNQVDAPPIPLPKPGSKDFVPTQFSGAGRITERGINAYQQTMALSDN